MSILRKMKVEQMINYGRDKSGPYRGKRLPITRRYDLMCSWLFVSVLMEREVLIVSMTPADLGGGL
jgi:hypothetical protein